MGLSIEGHCEISAVFLEDFNTIVVTIYRPPSGDFELFLDVFSSVVHRVSKSCNVVFNGDFNVHFHTAEKNAVAFDHLLRSFNLVTLIEEPTRLNNCIDNFLVCRDKLSEVFVEDILLSDHKVITLTQQMCGRRCERMDVRYRHRPMTQVGFCNFHNFVGNLNFDFVKTDSLCVSKKFAVFVGLIAECALSAFPEIVVCRKAKQTVLWYNNSLRAMRNQLHLLADIYNRYPTEANKCVLKEKQNAYKKLVYETKEAANRDYLEFKTILLEVCGL